MIKYRIGIQLLNGINKPSVIIIFNCKLNEIVYESWIRTEDIIDFFSDLSIPVLGTSIKISAKHPTLIELKNLGYNVSEV